MNETEGSREITVDQAATEPALWSCKIGAAPRGLLPKGSDAPMRRAVEQAYESVMGFPADFTFSGWGAALSEGEQAFIDKRPPDLEAEAIERLRCLPSWSPLRQYAEAGGWVQ